MPTLWIVPRNQQVAPGDGDTIVVTSLAEAEAADPTLRERLRRASQLPGEGPPAARDPAAKLRPEASRARQAVPTPAPPRGR